ncbi:MAG: hypothetical protein JF606_24730 [Burkholderiales bacterium]|nr:hypothetical protein [Burkholderiales bacterium]
MNDWHWRRIRARTAGTGSPAEFRCQGSSCRCYGPPSIHAREATREYIAYLRLTMGEAARNMEPFLRRTDWSRFRGLPLFDAANRMNAYNTFLLMEQQRD